MTAGWGWIDDLWVDEQWRDTGDDFPMADYISGSVTQVACTVCGGREFHVGHGEFLTALRCVKCLVPFSFYEG